MMSRSSKERVYDVVSRVFGVPVSDIRGESGPDTIEGWDSLTHLNLVMALEAEFGVSLTPEDTMELLSIDLIQSILADHGVRDTHGG